MARKKKKPEQKKRILAILQSEVSDMWNEYCEAVPDITTQQGRIGNLLRIWKKSRKERIVWDELRNVSRLH